jgi:hypothetical protein
MVSAREMSHTREQLELQCRLMLESIPESDSLHAVSQQLLASFMDNPSEVAVVELGGASSNYAIGLEKRMRARGPDWAEKTGLLATVERLKLHDGTINVLTLDTPVYFGSLYCDSQNTEIIGLVVTPRGKNVDHA